MQITVRPIFKFLHENFIFFENSCTVMYSSIFATSLLTFVILGIVFASQILYEYFSNVTCVTGLNCTTRHSLTVKLNLMPSSMN
jgi:hypothetical protein